LGKRLTVRLSPACPGTAVASKTTGSSVAAAVDATIAATIRVESAIWGGGRERESGRAGE